MKSGGTAEWPAWEIYPGSAWNYGLVLNEKDPQNDIEVVKKDWPSLNRPFTIENAPVKIIAKARKIPQWQLDENGLVEELRSSPAFSTESEETITLVPMGYAQIRIASFPTVSTDEKRAYNWKIITHNVSKD